MNFKVIGLKGYDFVNDKTGERVQGIKLYLTYTDDKVNGYACDNVNISLAKFDENIKPGSSVNVFYNKYGKVEQVQLIK